MLLAPLIVLLPMAFGIDGVWYAMPMTESVTFIIARVILFRLNGRYGHMPEGHPTASCPKTTG